MSNTNCRFPWLSLIIPLIMLCIVSYMIITLISTDFTMETKTFVVTIDERTTYTTHAGYFRITNNGDLLFYDTRHELCKTIAEGEWKKVEIEDERIE